MKEQFEISNNLPENRNNLTYFEVDLTNDLGPRYKSKLELKSNSSKILPVNCKIICVHIFFFVLKVGLKNL